MYLLHRPLCYTQTHRSTSNSLNNYSIPPTQGCFTSPRTGQAGTEQYMHGFPVKQGHKVNNLLATTRLPAFPVPTHARTNKYAHPTVQARSQEYHSKHSSFQGETSFGNESKSVWFLAVLVENPRLLPVCHFTQNKCCVALLDSLQHEH